MDFGVRFFLLIWAGSWLLGCGPQATPQSADQTAPMEAKEYAAYMAAGKTVVSQAFQALSSRLKAAMQAEGVPGALQYCNTAAYPLTDSLATAMGVALRRTSLRPRNAANTPSEAERALLEAMAADSAAQPQVVPRPGGGATYYHPIVVQAACLACHGVPGQTLATTDHALIQSLYPVDQATGYAEGDFRGMWRVDFEQLPAPNPE